MLRRLLATTGLAAALPLAACGGAADKIPTDDTRAASSEAPAVAATGTVIEVRMITDEKGNYFEPNEIEARRGDVVRFVLTSGVHNVNFLASENPGKTGLPAPSDYLQLPGQTYDLMVDLAAGRYYLQCDPHAALGMIGHLTVEE